MHTVRLGDWAVFLFCVCYQMNWTSVKPKSRRRTKKPLLWRTSCQTPRNGQRTSPKWWWTYRVSSTLSVFLSVCFSLSLSLSLSPTTHFLPPPPHAQTRLCKFLILLMHVHLCSLYTKNNILLSFEMYMCSFLITYLFMMSCES